MQYEDVIQSIPDELPEIKQLLNDNQQQQHYKQEGNIQIIYLPESHKVESILQAARDLVLYFATHVPGEIAKSAPQRAIIYLALTEIDKTFPEKGQPFTEKNMNTGHCIFPGGNVEEGGTGYIVIYRMQEWKKVLLHELFHWSGLTVSENPKSNVSLPVRYAEGGKKLSNGVDWTESLVELSASVLYQHYIRGLKKIGDDTSNWAEDYAKAASEYLERAIGWLLHTLGPRGKQNGPGYLYLKWLFWTKVRDEGNFRRCVEWLTERIWRKKLARKEPIMVSLDIKLFLLDGKEEKWPELSYDHWRWEDSNVGNWVMEKELEAKRWQYGGATTNSKRMKLRRRRQSRMRRMKVYWLRRSRKTR